MVTKRARRKPVPSTISAAKFKATCLELMTMVAQTGESVVITKRGHPVAVLSPVRPKRRQLGGSWAGRIEILGDLISPIDVAWDAEHDDGR